MFGSTPNRAAAYAKVAVETGVTTADPHRLVLMLFDGAMLAVSTGAAAMERADIAAKGQSTSKAIEIITNGLKASLDIKAGGELAERLSALYDYMCERLVYANLHNNRAALDEVSSLLEGLREAWQGIAPSAQKTA
jgi:flagellar protein FliS